MSSLNPRKLHLTYLAGTSADSLVLPRRYTLTHSDRTGDLFLTIGAEYDRKQISGIYTRLMRDEVLAEFIRDDELAALHVFVHVSGGLVFGTAGWRNDILHTHMPMVLEAFRYGDREMYQQYPEMAAAEVLVHFASHRKRYHQVEGWGSIEKYKLQA